MAEAVSPALPAGAGRILDVVWPNRETFYTGATTSTMMARLGFQSAAGAVQQWAVNGGSAYARWRGHDCIQFYSTVFVYPNGVGWRFDAGAVHVAQEKGHPGDGSLTNDYACYRILANLAYPPSPVGAPVGDFGLEMCVGVNGDVDHGRIFDAVTLTPGFGFKLTADDEVSLLCRGPLGLELVPLTSAAAGFDHELFHCYELRILSATVNTEAQVKWFIDGVFKASRQWGPGTNLPAQSAAGAIYGFKPFIANTTGQGFFVDQFRAIAAPTELATL